MAFDALNPFADMTISGEPEVPVVGQPAPAAGGAPAPAPAPQAPINPTNDDPWGLLTTPAAPPAAAPPVAAPPAAAPVAAPAPVQFQAPPAPVPTQAPPAMPAQAPPAPPAAPPAQAPPAADPFAVYEAQPQVAIVPSSTPSADPFGVFGTSTPAAFAPAAPPPAEPAAAADPFGGGAPPPAAAPPAAPEPEDDDDFWGNMGFGLQQAASTEQPEKKAEGGRRAKRSVRASIVAQPPVVAADYEAGDHKALDLDDHNLPKDGEYYTARINSVRLGVMFFKAKQLTSSLFLKVDKDVIKAFGDRPIVAYTAINSASDHSGICVGHILIEVNGKEVKTPHEALHAIKGGTRPMNLKLYQPSVPITISENQHMVKYDTKDTMRPMKSFDWKPKYVVVGGIIAKPWMMNMYRSKAEYDKAVVEVKAGRHVSVKVKAFDLRGSHLYRDDRDIHTVKYHNLRSEWHYIIVIPAHGNPIKISHPVRKGLAPVHEGIRRVISNKEYSSTSYGYGQQTRAAAYGQPQSQYSHQTHYR